MLRSGVRFFSSKATQIQKIRDNVPQSVKDSWTTLPKAPWTTYNNRTSDYLKLYVLKVFFSNKFITAQVYHTPTRTVAAAASSQEKELRKTMETHSDKLAAAKIGEILANRLKSKEIPAIHFFYTNEQRYHGKLKSLIDSIRENGVSFVG